MDAVFLGGCPRAGCAGGVALVRPVENTPAPINRIPQDIFSLIPGQCDMEEALIMLTHVFRGWREQLISFSLLWTSLDCASVDQTRVYLESSKVSPLNIYLGGVGHPPFMDDALLLTVPHLNRLKSMSISRSSNDLTELTKHFLHCHAPLLGKLGIRPAPTNPPTIQIAIFNRNLSSLRELCISGALTTLPWTSLTNFMTDFESHGLHNSAPRLL